MSFLFKWIKKCFKYFLLGKVADQLIEKINNDQTLIASEVKSALISSIILNQPDKLLEQIDQLPSQPREELLTCIAKSVHIKNDEGINYRQFTIASEKYKTSVDHFYDQPDLDQCHIDHAYDNKLYKYEDLAIIMFDLYAQDEMWIAFNKLDYKPEVMTWAKQIKSIFSKMLSHVFETHTLMEVDKKIQASYTQTVILTLVVLYSRMFISPHLGFGSVLKEILIDCLDSSSKGMVTAFLTFAYYCPDLVADDIHPFINRETPLYKGTDFNKIRENHVFGSLYQKYQKYV